MSCTLSAAPVDSPAVARTLAVSIRELPLTTIDSGVEQAPGALSCAYNGAALSAANASIHETILRITQIYTSQFGRGPRRRASTLIRQRGCWRVACLQQPRLA